MRDAEKAVEKVMAGLQQVEAGPGLERRVMDGVKGRVAGSQSVGFFGGPRWVGVCCVVVLLSGIGEEVWRVERHKAVALNAGAVHEAGVEARRNQVGKVEEGVSQRLKPGSGRLGDGTVGAVPLSKAGSGVRVSAGMGAVRLVRSSQESSVEREAEAVSFPAPPLPLTEQERLLLRAARRGDPVPVASFEVSVLPSGDAEETAEFIEFFGRERQLQPRTSGESE